MSNDSSSVRSFRERINTARQKTSWIVLVSAGIFWVIVLLLFTDYFKDVNIPLLLTIICIGNSAMLLQVFYKNPPRIFKIFLHVILHAAVIIAFPLLLPPVTPFVIYIAVFGILAYIDFGKKGLYISLLTQLVGITSLFIAFGKIQGFQTTVECLASYTLVMVLAYFMSIFFDLTTDELQEVERTSKRNSFERERLLALVNNMDDAVLVCDSNFKILLTNPATQALFDTHAKLPGSVLSKHLKLEDEKGPITIPGIIKLNKRSTVRSDLKLILPKNDPVSLFLAVTYVGLEDQSELNYIIVMRDITKEKTLEDERNEFVSIMSHELRTPVSIVEGSVSNASFLLNRKEYDKAQKFMGSAESSIAMLASIVNSLSMLVHSEKSGDSLETQEISPIEIMQSIHDNFQARAAEKKLKIKLTTGDNIPNIETNKEYVYEILQNFMTNAIKYTDDGTIEITAKVTKDKHVWLSVKDSGIGMSSSDLKHVFEKFWRSEDYHTRQSSGTGMGLYITRKLTSSLGGRVDVKSHKGDGSTFSLILPIKFSKKS